MGEDFTQEFLGALDGWRWFFLNSNPKFFYTSIFGHIEHLDNPIDHHTPICPDNNRSHFVKGEKGFQFFS